MRRYFFFSFTSTAAIAILYRNIESLQRFLVSRLLNIYIFYNCSHFLEMAQSRRHDWEKGQRVNMFMKLLDGHTIFGFIFLL